MTTHLKLPAFRRFVESSAWAIHPERGLALLELLEARAIGDRLPLSASQSESGKRRASHEARSSDRRVTKSGSAIAVLPMCGVIAQRMDMMMAWCGGTSTEAFADAFDAAMNDPNVSAIVIDCDSPGGNVQGTPELAKRIFDARGKGKKIVAVVNSTMASAAYWICSAADEIVCTPSGEVGSIGVFCVHVDQSAMNDRIGLKYTLVKAGEHKAETNPWEPLSDDAKSFMQGQVDEMNTMFVQAVAKHRGTNAQNVNENFGQGRCFTAKQAKAVGMIDRIATLQDTLRGLGATNVGANGRQPQALGAQAIGFDSMSEPTTAHLIGSAAVASAEDDDEPKDCPDCGEPLDNDGACTCGSKAPAASEDDEIEEDEEADEQDDEGAKTSASPASTEADARQTLPPAAGAVDAGLSPAPDSQPHAAQELDMNEQVQAALAEERKRVADIRKLGEEHSIEASVINGLVDSGATMVQATEKILATIKANRSGSPIITVGADRAADRPFASFGEQLVAVVQAGKPGGRRDPRLDRVNAQAQAMLAGSPSGMNESIGSEGGFFIQNDLLPEVTEPIYKEDPLLSRVTRIPVGQGKNGVAYNVVDEKDRRDGSRWGGIRMYWGDEADSPAASKPKLRRVEHSMKKLIGLAYLTDELMEDAPAAQKLLTDAFQAENAFMLTSAIFRGTGGGQPLGFLKSKAVQAVAIEGSQTIANSSQYIGLNVTKMLSLIPSGLWDEVIFLYNQELLPYLVTATIGAGGAAVPVFIGAGGLVNRPFDTILGRPAYASEQCEAVGTPGDIIAIAPSQYHLSDKGGPNQAMSLHVRFVYDEAVLRITQRVDGKPVWDAPVVPYKGASNRSPFITLAARS